MAFFFVLGLVLDALFVANGDRHRTDLGIVCAESESVPTQRSGVKDSPVSPRFQNNRWRSSMCNTLVRVLARQWLTGVHAPNHDKMRFFYSSHAVRCAK